MEKSRFSEEQVVQILREAGRSPVPEVARRHGTSDQTIYAWRKRFGELDPADVKRLRQLDSENAKLEKLVAERGACNLLSVARSTLKYESVLAKRDAPVVGAMRELAAQYPRRR